jgi:hypothetical protein
MPLLSFESIARGLRHKTPKALLLGSLLSFFLSNGAQQANAASVSFSGNLRTDATVLSCGTGCTLDSTNSDGEYAQYAAVIKSFAVTSASSVQIVSFSYGGGVNGNGAVIPEGGLEPYLSLFDSTGAFLSSTYFGVTCPAGAHANTSSGECFDVLLDAGTLAPGTYEIALSAYLNMSFAENLGIGTLADGFTGLGNLGFGENLSYAFDVNLSAPTTPPDTTPVPEPTTGALVALASFGLRLLQHRRTKGDSR